MFWVVFTYAVLDFQAGLELTDVESSLELSSDSVILNTSGPSKTVAPDLSAGNVQTKVKELTVAKDIVAEQTEPKQNIGKDIEVSVGEELVAERKGDVEDTDADIVLDEAQAAKNNRTNLVALDTIEETGPQSNYGEDEADGSLKIEDVDSEGAIKLPSETNDMFNNILNEDCETTDIASDYNVLNNSLNENSATSEHQSCQLDGGPNYKSCSEKGALEDSNETQDLDEVNGNVTPRDNKPIKDKSLCYAQVSGQKIDSEKELSRCEGNKKVIEDLKPDEGKELGHDKKKRNQSYQTDDDANMENPSVDDKPYDTPSKDVPETEVDKSVMYTQLGNMGANFTEENDVPTGIKVLKTYDPLKVSSFEHIVTDPNLDTDCDAENDDSDEAEVHDNDRVRNKVKRNSKVPRVGLRYEKPMRSRPSSKGRLSGNVRGYPNKRKCQICWEMEDWEPERCEMFELRVLCNSE